MKERFGSMKKLYLIWPLICLISNSYSCSFSSIKLENNKEVNVCVEGDSLYSKDCKNVVDCISENRFAGKLNPRMNPGNSLCFALKGEVQLVVLKGQDKEVCVFPKSKVISLDYLFKNYMK